MKYSEISSKNQFPRVHNWQVNIEETRAGTIYCISHHALGFIDSVAALSVGMHTCIWVHFMPACASACVCVCFVFVKAGGFFYSLWSLMSRLVWINIQWLCYIWFEWKSSHFNISAKDRSFSSSSLRASIEHNSDRPLWLKNF